MTKLEQKKNENSEYDGPPLSSQPHPWLVICPSTKIQTFFNISEGRCYERTIEEFGNTMIHASAQEWLVLDDFDSTDCYLWNPISNHKIQLPPLPYDENLKCLLFAPPNDPKCRVLFLIKETTPPDDDNDDDVYNDENDSSNDDTNSENPDYYMDNEDPYDDDYPDPNDDSDDDDMNDDNPDDDDDAMDHDDDVTDNENPDDDDDTDNENPNDDDTDSDEDDVKDDNPNNDEIPPALYLWKPGFDQEFYKQDLKSIIGDDCFFVWTVFKGDFYVLTLQTGILLRLDVDDSSGTISATPVTHQPPYYNYFREFLDMPRFGGYLIQSSSHDNDDEIELLYVHKLFNGREFEEIYKMLVFRFDFVNKVWEEKKSIGETVIFLGVCFGGTTCCTRGTNLKKESIYFTMGRYLYIFNLEKQSISVSLPCPHISITYPRSYWLTLDESLRHSFQV